MSKHKRQIENYNGDLESLANELGDLRYDALSDFLEKLSQKLSVDSEADFKRNRPRLSENLKEASDQLQLSANVIAKAWIICEPYMKSDE